MSIQNFPATYTDPRTNTQVRFPNPSKGISEGVQANSLVMKFDSGTEQRRQKSKPLRIFTCDWEMLPEPAWQVLLNFYFEHTTAKSFYWTNSLTKEIFLCRFDNDTLTSEHNTTSNVCNYFKISIKLVQVLS